MERKTDKLLASKYFPILYFIIAVLFCILRNRSVLNGSKELIAGDAQSTYYTIDFLKNCFLNGEVPLWNRFLANGTPFLGVSYSLFNLYNFLCLFFHAELIYFLEYVFFISIGSTFFYMYLCKIGCRKKVGLIFAIIYLLSIHLGGSRTSHLVIIITVACLPIILYFVELYCEKRKFYLLLIMALVMAVQFHNGFMQTCLYSDIVVFLYFMVRYVQSGGEWKKGLGKSLQWIGVYAILIIGYVIPIFEILAQFSSGSSASSSFSYFITGSIHPLKLLMMFIPDLWNDVYTPLADFGMGTSGMDIEIFMGTLVILLSIAGIGKYLMKNRYIALFSFFVFISMIFASCGAFFLPLARLLFKIPVINMFRMPSRVMFVFIFFILVIASVTLSNIFNEKRYALLYKVCFLYILFWGILCLTEVVTDIKYLELIFSNGKSIALCVGIFGICVFVLSKGKALYQNKTLIENVICIFVLIITVLQTMEYNQVKEVDLEKHLLPVEENMVDKLGNHKILQASTNDISYVKSIVNYNRALFTGMPTINAELAFNNPALTKFLMPSSGGSNLLNQTNALAFFKNSRDNLVYQNDLLSMLGVKYVVDSESLVDGLEILDRNNVKTRLLLDEFEVKATEPMVVFAQPLELQSNCDYNISFEYKCDNWDSSIYFDLYADNYDNSDQDVILGLTSGEDKYSITVNSGQIPQNAYCFFRIISNGTTDITFANLSIKEVGTKKNDTYKLIEKGKGFYDTEAVVYENINARDILYVPEQVIDIDDTTVVYDYLTRESLDKVSYVEDMQGFTPGEMKITDIRWQNNIISARVEAKTVSFINFSQNMMKGWNAYIDGKQTQNIRVNGLIQGAVIPEGTHEILFKYVPKVTIISGIVNLFFFIIVTGVAAYQFQKREKE